ncbi:hypothetical protein TNCV_4038761 [Trichonephila clavipes]|nr:hypothetical protein TNCV_4038761 [Trichonephila clavipes]
MATVKCMNWIGLKLVIVEEDPVVVKEECTDISKHKDWSSSRLDLNPFDYKLWSVLKTKVCQKRNHNLDRRNDGNYHGDSTCLEKIIGQRYLKTG